MSYDVSERPEDALDLGPDDRDDQDQPNGAASLPAEDDRCEDCHRSYGPHGCPRSCDCDCHGEQDPADDDDEPTDGWTEQDYIEHLTERMLEREAFGE
jgi:hypothetical protein